MAHPHPRKTNINDLLPASSHSTDYESRMDIRITGQGKRVAHGRRLVPFSARVMDGKSPKFPQASQIGPSVQVMAL